MTIGFRAIINSNRRSAMIEIQLGRCVRCGQRFNMSRGLKPDNPDAPTIDHVMPLGFGGLDAPGNWTVIHRKCNARKGARPANGCERIWAQVNGAKLAGVNANLLMFDLASPRRPMG